jgi:DNA polymerase-3 subunit alpha
MSAIKNVGKAAVEEMIKSRNALGRDFTGIFDFCANVDSHIVNKRSLEGLVLSGAFDSCGVNRATLFDSIETVLEWGHKIRNSRLSTTDSLFGGAENEMKISEPVLPDVKPWSAEYRLAKEREVLGFYVTGHPLSKYEFDYRNFASIHLGETEALEDYNDVVKACGVVTALKTKIDKAGRTMAFFTLDDFSGSCEALMFSKVYEKCGRYLEEEKCIFIIGKTESSGDAIKLHIDDVFPLEEARERFLQSVNVIFNRTNNDAGKILFLKKIFGKSKGAVPIFLHLGANGSKPRRFFLKDYRIKVTNEFISGVTQLLGEDALVMNKK